MATLDLDEGVDQEVPPLHRREPAERDDHRRTRSLASRAERRVDAGWHHGDAGRVEAELFDELLA